MPSADNLQPDSRFVGLFIGHSGSGKTSAAASFPKPMKVYDFDGRIRGILGCPWIDKKGIDYEYYPPRNKPGESTFTKVNADFESLLLMTQKGMSNYKTIVLDSLTSAAFALVCDALPLTHGGNNKGKKLGSMLMPGPEDYGFESQGIGSILTFLRSLPVQNIICMAHVVDRYGKADPSNPYADSVVVGEKLSLRDKIAENSQIYFDHIFRFDKKEQGNTVKHYVKFRGDIARTSFNALPDGEIDITGVNFYEKLMARVMPQPQINESENLVSAK